MRTDLTVRTSTGPERDVAVIAPADATWDDVVSLVRGAVPDADPRWCGRRALRPRMLVGRPPLVSGAILTCDRPAIAPTSTVRLEVVGGRGYGSSVAVGGADLTIGRDPGCD